MECLTTLVGLRDCTGSGAVFNLNDIGISSNQLEELKDDSFASVSDWLEATKTFAAERLATDVITGLANDAVFNTLLEAGTTGKYKDTSVETTASGLAGIKITIPNNKEYIKLNINTISLFTDYTGDINVLLIDLVTGRTLHSTTVEVEAGEISTKNVSFEVKSAQRKLELALVYDATDITSYKTTLGPSDCTSCNGWGKHTSDYSTFNMIKLNEPRVISTVERATNTAGLSFEYSISCDSKGWVCNIAHLLGLAMLYKTAYELFAYSIHSGGQFSNQKVTNFENNTERMTSFEYNYGQELAKVLKTAKLPIGICFSCNPKVRFLNKLP